MSDDLRNLGAAVRAMRERHGLSVADLAAAADVGPACLSALEQGGVDPAYDLLVRLADGLGTRPSEFVVLAERGEASSARCQGH
jgi:transcriptional regulator with XRE-family HTH domain